MSDSQKDGPPALYDWQQQLLLSETSLKLEEREKA